MAVAVAETVEIVMTTFSRLGLVVQRERTVWRILLICLLGGILSACIVVPWFEPEPFQEGELTDIIAGATTRDQVIDAFGQPTVSRENGTMSIYGEPRHVAFWLLLGKTDIGMGFVDDFQFLVVEYEQDTVKSIELV